MRNMLIDPVSGDLLSRETECLSAWREHSGAFIRVDPGGSDPSGDKALLGDTFGIHPLAVQDALRGRQIFRRKKWT